MSKMLKLIFALFLFQISLSANGQIDTEFWFAAPDIIATHGDSPIFLRITALDQDAKIVIDQPANSAFAPYTQYIAAGNSISIELTNYKGYLENTPANTILNYGLHLSSNVSISAYYEIAHRSNSDIFTLKGKNGLGTKFYIPAQSDFDNQSINYKAYSSFDIVATEDNTEVTITPAKDVVGHKAGQEFIIHLNKGQTFCVQATSASKSQHLGGSKVTSNRPIAVTIKDDSVNSANCNDIIGDQLVPVNVIGKEYIAVRGFLNAATKDRVYILATESNTQLYLDGSTTAVSSLSEGQQYALQLTDPAKYIKTSAPVYVLHVSGFGCQMGGALLPQINCTGSETMSFYRSANTSGAASDYFGMVLLCPKGYENNFLVDGKANIIMANNFTAVPGTTDWMSASIDLSNAIKAQTTSVVTNKSGVFNMGIMNGETGSTCRYGYFSNFSSLNIGNDRIVCQGDTVSLDAGKGAESYLWNTGETTQTISALKNDLYSVKIKRGLCELMDTMKLTVNSLPKINLGNDTNICIGKSIRLSVPSNYYKYSWYNGNITSSMQTDTTGLYWINVIDFNNCKKTDSINVTVQELPKISLRDTLFCGTMSGTVRGNMDQQGKALWKLPLGSPLTIAQPDSFSTLITAKAYNTYSLVFQGVSKYGCLKMDSLKIGFYKIPTSSFSLDSAKCYGDNIDVNYTGNASISAFYKWNFDDCQVLSGQNQGPYKLGLGISAIDKNLSLQVEEDGCKSLISQKTLKVRPTFSFKSDTISGCEPLVINFTAQTNKPSANFKWMFSDSTSIISQNPKHIFKSPGKYDVTLLITAPNGCQNGYTQKNMITVFQIPTSKISLDSLTCYADTITAKYLGNASNSAHYQWNFGDISTISGNNQGPYSIDICKSTEKTIKLRVEENGCYSILNKILLKRNPHISIFTSYLEGCQPLKVEFGEQNLEANMTYKWNIGEDTVYTQPTFNHIFKYFGSEYITLQVTSKTSGCTKIQKLPQPIAIYRKPTAEFTLQPKFTLIDNPNITFFNTSKFATLYQWNFGDQTTSTEEAPVHLYDILGKFTVRLVATTEHQCRDTAYNDVTVGAFYAPNAFCPTSNIPDNRIFRPLCAGMELQDYVMLIFNRWGSKIYESKDPGIGWDGTINASSPAEAGPYVWIISYRDIRGKLHKNSGYITLLR